MVMAILLVLAPWGIESTDLVGSVQAVFFGFSVGDDGTATINVDVFGNVIEAVDYGCMDGVCTPDEELTSHTTPGLVGETGWRWAPEESWLVGSDHGAWRSELDFAHHTGRACAPCRRRALLWQRGPRLSR